MLRYPRLLLIASLLAFQEAPPTAVARRRITKEPAYIAEPRYGLFVLNEKDDVQARAVFDKSNREFPYYDVVYFDVDDDGDLTEPDERFTGNFNADAKGLRIQVGYEVNGSDKTSRYRRFEFHTVLESNGSAFLFSARWNGQVNLSGGYGDVSTGGTVYGTSPATAPCFRLEPTGPLSFGLGASMGDGGVLKIGETSRLAFVVGRIGEGANTLTTVDIRFLDFEKDPLYGELIGRDSSGREVRVPFPIRKRC